MTGGYGTVDREKKAKPSYEPPRVVLHSKDEIIRNIGPAVGCARWSITSPYGTPRR